jgi:hypothetical protein
MTYVGRLPAPTTENWDWQVHALCRGMDSLVFFHPWGERGPERDDRDRRAKAVCADCPVIGLPGLRVDRWADRGGATAPAAQVTARPAATRGLARTHPGDDLDTCAVGAPPVGRSMRRVDHQPRAPGMTMTEPDPRSPR